MRAFVRRYFPIALSLGLLTLACWATYVVARAVWQRFVALDATLAAGMVTAATTVIAATITVMIGRYFERKREIESHFRKTKVEIYDEFLVEFFKVFYAVSSPRPI